MSVIYNEGNVILFSHKLFLDNLFKQSFYGGKRWSFYSKANFFSIAGPYKIQRNKIKQAQLDSLVVKRIREGLEAVKSVIESRKEFYASADLKPAKLEAENYYSACSLRRLTDFKGGNINDTCIVVLIQGDKYLIPNNCLFYNYDILRIGEFISDTFDFILIDPPWWNKFIRRKKANCVTSSYNMLWDTDLMKLPISKLNDEEGLVAIWCTNSESHWNMLMNEILPAWGVKYVSTWIWLKVTTDGQPVTPFSPPNGKQPYEKLVFAARNPHRKLPLPEEDKLLVSVPSAIHSHKPPLSEVIQPYVPASPRCLELFARYLLPNWTSFGNEVLKLQHISFFSESKNGSLST